MANGYHNKQVPPLKKTAGKGPKPEGHGAAKKPSLPVKPFPKYDGAPKS